MPADRIVLEPQHVIEGRARLRSERPMRAEDLTALADRIAALGPVRRVLARPATNSLIVEFSGPVAPLIEQIAVQDIARIAPRKPPPPVGQLARLSLVKADMAIRKSTDGTLDFNATLALLLLMGAAVQLTRGRVAGPATTLALAALSLLNQNKAKT